MSAKHTPGPWEVDEYGVSSEAVLGIARTYHAATRVMWSGSDFATLAHCEANARLIAAAPDLLEALKRMESAFDWFVGRSAFTQGGPLKGAAHSDRVRKEVYAAHDAVRAAIAKATGEQA